MKHNTIYRYALVLVMMMSTLMGMAQYKDARIRLNNNYFSNIGYKPNVNTKLVIKMKKYDYTRTYEFGSYKDKNKFYVSHSGKTFMAFFGQAETSVTLSAADSIKTRNQPFYMTLSKDGFGIDFDKLKTRHDYTGTFSDYGSFTEGYPIVLSNINDKATVSTLGTDGADIYVYELWIYEGEKLVHHYYPSNVGSDKFYDVITNQTALCYSNNRVNSSEIQKGYDYDINAKTCHHMYTHFEGSGVNLKFVCELCGDVTNLSQAKPSSGELSVNDPNIDIMAKIPGEQSLVVTAMNKMTNLLVMDSVTCELLFQKSFYDNPATVHTLSLPPYDDTRTLMVLANTFYTDGQDSIYTWSKQYVKYLPLHTISQFEVKELQNINKKTGIRRPANYVMFAIDNFKVKKEKKNGEDVIVAITPSEQDVVGDDLFMLERAYRSDFADAETIKTWSFGEISAVDTLKVGNKDVIRGWFLYVDNDEEALCNTTETTDSLVFIGDEELLKSSDLTANEKKILREYFTYPERHVYYRVSRTFVSSLWQDPGDYEKTKVTNSACMLPGVTTVSVEKTKDWSENKKVKLNVRLDNPYPWEFNQLLDSAKVHTIFNNSSQQYGRRYIWDKNAKITIKRFSPDNEHSDGIDYASKTFVINGSNVVWNDSLKAYFATVEDVQNLPYLHYYYSAVVDSASSPFPVAYNEVKLTTRESADECYSENSMLISALKVSKGDVRGSIELEWEQGDYQLDNIKILRREYGKENAKWDEIHSGKETITTYQDNTALIGSVYEYQVVGSMTITYRKDLKCENTLEDWGYVPYYGKMAGRVMMNNGTSMAGVKLRITRDEPIHIDDVFDRYGSIMMQGVHEGVDAHARPLGIDNSAAQDTTVTIIDKDKEFLYQRYVTTDEEGKWEADSLIFTSGGSKYVVEVMEYPGEFEYMGVVQAPQITLSKTQYENTDVRLMYISTKRVSGYAYYRNSTIPVPNANFYLDGVMLYNSNGEPLRTQPDGKFTLTVSSMKKINKLEIRKDGHKFTDDGVMISDKVVKTDLDGFIMYDDTKVRLAGRVVGGHVEADKPLGFGLSKNNLGDEIKLVLQLEGDNSASIVYFPNDPNRTSVVETVNHEIYNVTNEVRDTSVVGSTTVTSERKRIVIDVDNNTGEYMADLYPAKYKVVQMYCKGYSTLYRANEGFAVIDLSDYKPGIDMEDIHTDSIRDGRWSTWYDATFNRTYHNPVKVTYVQYINGKAVPFFGDESIKISDPLSGEVTVPFTKQIKVGTPEAQRDSTYYTFNHPVFNSGKRYIFTTTTHEDYVYNNEDGNKIDIVPVPYDTLIVRNGICSANDVVTAVNNENGQAMIVLTANNPTFFDVGDNALRSANFMVKSNGYYYEAEPLRAIVLGDRTLGKDVVSLGQSGGVKEVVDGKAVLVLGDLPEVIDILRDPPGSKSYSYREAGTTYSWNYHKSISEEEHFKLTFGGGVAIKTGIGLGFTQQFESELQVLDASLNWLTHSAKADVKREYTMKLNERISTSSDPRDVGASADIYIGKVDRWGAELGQHLTVLNKSMYEQLKPGIDAGIIDILGEGRGVDGQSYYIAITESYNLGRLGMSSFAYSQKYILNTLIPDLEQQIANRVVKVSSQDDIKKLENDKAPRYWYELNSDAIGWNGQGKVNECESLRQTIDAWKKIIEENESIKIAKMAQPDSIFKRYSVADAKIAYSEDVHSQDVAMEWKLKELPHVPTWELSAGYSNKPKTDTKRGSFFGGSGGSLDEGIKDIDKNGMGINDDDGADNIDVAKPLNSDRMLESAKLAGMGVFFKLGLGGGGSTSANTTKDYSNIKGGGFGFELGTNDNGYFDVAVYDVAPANSYYVSADASVNADFNSNAFSDVDGHKETITPDKMIHNFIFVTEGGAARNPWTAPDSTVVLSPKQALGAPLLKIDNPKIYVDKPVVNNITKDENAVFSIRLTNETEIQNGDHSKMNASSFHLKVDDKSNPYGAKIYMDGQPISSGRDFSIAPGQSITKTIEVERGSKEYNYDDLRLVFSDAMYTLSSDAKISVHYLPTSTPLRLSVPTDKWVMNTFSQMDEEGKYYIPVEITDYSLTYDNFDHIDLQYKKATEGESQWVTLCSYYADEELYNKASGKKGKIDSGSKINNIKFYGGANIEEQEYNLRAVSYCRMGNDFVTRASDVISGIKDTRRPEIFGVPSPKDGILSFDEVIQFPFTERIAYNHLNATSNFTVQGYTNEMMGTFSNPLFFNGDASTIVSSEVERSLANRDFTIDLMVKMEQDRFNTPLFAVGNVTNYASFWTADVTDKEDSDRYFRFALYTPERIYASPRIKTDLKASLTRVGVIVDNQAKKVQFLVDKNIYDCDGKSMLELADQEDTIYVGNTVYGPVYVGFDPSYDIAHHKGEITEVRLWNKALNTIEVNQTYNKRLSGYNRDLIGYWPMNEAVGDYAYDEVNGATLNLQGASWESDKGVALVADSVEVRLKADAIAGAMNEDYTMRFWFRTRPFESKAGKAYIFRAGNDELAKGKGRMSLAYENGQLVLNSMDENRIIGSQDEYADGKWHNFTLVVSRSRNTFATYLDKELKLQGGADEMDHPDNGYISLGDSTLYMNFDEMSVWAKALPDYYIDKFYNSRLHGTESDMIVYLPFEEETLDSHNLPVRTFSAKNQKLSERVVQYPDGTSENTGEMVADGTVLILDNEEKGYGENLGYDVLRYEVSCAPLKNSPELRNLPFSWSSTGTALQININQNDADINKQNIYVTVRDIEDEQGNTLKSPHMWTYFVDKNVLRWNTQAVNITVPYGETTEKKVMWKNVSGRSSNYSIVNKASWLSLSNDFKMTNPATTLIGYANAEEENEVTLHIGDGISPGFYSETIYLTDENGLSEPLHVNLTVEALKPLWDVDPAKYEYNMNMKAVVMVKGREDNVIDTDTRDIVGAFVGLECVGKGNIITKDNNSYVYMTIYGNKTMQEKKSKVRFRLWSASTGLISEMDRSTDINGRMTKETLIFNNGSFVGIPPSNPDELTVNNITEQQIEVQPGWNWIAFNVMPKPTSKTDSLFSHFSGFTEGDIIKRVDYSTYSEGTYNWYGTLCNLDYAHTYQVFAKNGGRLGIRGTNPEEFLKDVSVLGNKWFDLPYHLKVVQPLSVALADFRIGEKANIGDIIKSYNSFAVATENGWEGTLQYMRPGEGYYIYHSGENTSFRYPENANNSTQTTAYAKKLNPAIKVEALSETSMPVIAVLDEEVGIEKGDVLQAYCNGELISEANVLEVGEDKEKLFFLSLNANDGSVIEFTVKRGEEEIKAVTKVKYNSSVVVGSLDYPCVIRFSENHSRGEGHGDIYDLGGRKLQESDLLHNGIYIINNEKVVNK